MATTLIKIDRNSIRKNPRAGATSTEVIGSVEVNFSYDRISKEDWQRLKALESAGKGVIITKWSDTMCEGFVDYEDLLHLLPQNGLSYHVKKNIDTIYHLPEPKYTYRHEHTVLRCNNCNSDVLNTKILIDCNDDGCYNICPVCNGIETFDYEYEKISDVMP
jgi:hypothetical protein